MVKLGKAFSIIVVFALLIVLAPALVPGALSAHPAPPPALPNPLTVAFSAPIDYLGDAYTYNVIADPLVGSMGIQFSRPGYHYSSNITGCKFYNISAASGIIGGDLHGEIEMEWNRLNLNTPYPTGSPYIASPDGFGLLYMKGNLTTKELGDFKFIAVLDHDYTSTTAKGAGRMCTVYPWQNPTLVDINGSVDEVLVGEITAYTLTSTKISGTLNLRYYNSTKGEIDNNWQLMQLDGWLGGDKPDNITAGTMTLTQFTQPNMVVPSDPGNYSIAMEESHPGRETPGRIVGGYVGENGSITLNHSISISPWRSPPMIPDAAEML